MVMNYSPLPPLRESSPTQYITEWVWLHAKKTSFTGTDSRTDVAGAHSLLIPALQGEKQTF